MLYRFSYVDRKKRQDQKKQIRKVRMKESDKVKVKKRDKAKETYKVRRVG